VPLRFKTLAAAEVSWAERDDLNGVPHVVTAGGGMSMYDTTRHGKKFHAKSGGVFHFVKVTVTGGRAACQTILAEDGKVFDRFGAASRR